MKKELQNELSNRLEVKSRRMGMSHKTASSIVMQTSSSPLSTLSNHPSLSNIPVESWRADVLDFSKNNLSEVKSFDISDYENGSYALSQMIRSSKNKNDSTIKTGLKSKGLLSTPIGSIPMYEYYPSPNLWEEMETALTNLYVERTTSASLVVDPTRCAPIKLSL